MEKMEKYFMFYVSLCIFPVKRDNNVRHMIHVENVKHLNAKHVNDGGHTSCYDVIGLTESGNIVSTS